MIPLDTMPRDSVYIFSGGALPFILRPAVGFQSKYEIIGGCYIHGMMNREVVRSDKWREEDITL
jgi:hypothetical protein